MRVCVHACVCKGRVGAFCIKHIFSGVCGRAGKQDEPWGEEGAKQRSSQRGSERFFHVGTRESRSTLFAFIGGIKGFAFESPPLHGEDLAARCDQCRVHSVLALGGFVLSAGPRPALLREGAAAPGVP